MQASRAHPAPDQGHGPADDPEIPPWRAGYVTCPACHRPVRRERLARHMEILHADEPEAEQSAEPEPGSTPRGLRGILRKVFRRHGE